MRDALVALALVASLAALTACGDSDGSSQSGGSETGGGRADSITIAANTAPLSLDPAKNGNTVDMQLYMGLAYEPLIKLKPDGRLAPGLATSWRYLDRAQRAFELTLREARFSDGTPVTPQSVVDSIEHQKTANGPVAVYANAIASARATGPRTVRLDLARSDPTIAFVLTQRFLIGDVIGPRGTADPRMLGTRTLGAGPYVLDADATVANDRYTFVPNEHYYDQDAIHFDRFVIRVIRNPQTALQALRSRQVAFSTGSFTLAPAAEAAGLKVDSTLSSWYGVFLFDRDGESARPLASEQVRQALNYAADRDGITAALFGEYGEPSAQPSVPGYEGQGFVPSLQDRYPHDPGKARELLAEAGYPDGFALRVAATGSYGEGADMAQALASDWAKVGVDVEIDNYQDIAAIIPPWQAKRLPALAGYYDGQPMFIFAQQALAPNAGLFNPWRSEDAELTRLMDAAFAETDPEAQGAAWDAVMERVVELGWFVPIASGATVYFSEQDLKGVEVSPTSFAQDPTLLHY